MEVPKIRVPPECLRELVVGQRTFRSPCDFRLTEADLEKARRELKESEEGKDAAIRKLRDMLDNDKGMTYRTDDAYLLRYLRYRKFNCKEAYKQLRSFHMMRELYPELYRIPTRLESLLNTRIGNLLPYTDEEGKCVYIIKLGNWNTRELSFREVLPLHSLVSDVASMNPHVQIDGLIGIIDFADTGLGHVSQVMNPILLRLWTKLVQELYPWRIKRIILYNCSAIVYAALGIVKRFMKKKMADRIIVIRSDLGELHEHVNPSILPKEYGGSLDDDQCYSFIKTFLLGNTRYLEYEHSFIRSKKASVEPKGGPN